MKYSCSTFMLYLGLNKKFDLPHHTIIFAEDYKKNIEEVATTLTIPEDPSIYVQNVAATDSTMAPEGKSTLYILVPVPNNKSGIDWEGEKAAFREVVLTTLEKRAGLTGIRESIEEERIVTPLDWQNRVGIYRGATFNLAHNVGQMLVWRPHNKFEECDHCFLVGGGTHPGRGLPTIFESGRITSGIICKRDGVEAQ
jgi:phytoene desaturase